MGYQHIDNLYRDTSVLQEGPRVWVLEKIHGTSAHVAFADGQLRFFSGGAKQTSFEELFNKEELQAKFEAYLAVRSELKLKPLTVYGEAYGGSQQKMKETYGDKLQFVAFDVSYGDDWLSVPQAVGLVAHLGLDFVAHTLVPATLEEMNKWRDMPSAQAEKNIGATDKIREGIVIRPEVETTRTSGKRVIAKHKRNEFMETATPRDVDPKRLKVLEDSNAIANEWVVEERLNHILDKLVPPAAGMEDTKRVITAMIEDVRREGEGEMVWSNDVATAISKATARLFKARVSQIKEPA